MRNTVQVLLGATLAFGGYALGRAQTAASESRASCLLAQAAVADSGTWGEFRRSFGGPSSASADVLAGYRRYQGRHREPPAAYARGRGVPLSGGGQRHVDARRQDRSRPRPATRFTLNRTCSTASRTRQTTRQVLRREVASRSKRSYPGCPGYARVLRLLRLPRLPGLYGRRANRVPDQPGNLTNPEPTNPGNPGNRECFLLDEQHLPIRRQRPQSRAGS